MNQQGSAKPERQECLQPPEAQPGTTGGWFPDTHKHLPKHLLLWVGTTQHKATRHLPPQGPDPKIQITWVHPWLGEIALSHHLLWPAPRVCNLCSVYVFHVYSPTEENLKQHSFLMWRISKPFKANLKYWLLPLRMHQYFQQCKISSYKSSL